MSKNISKELFLKNIQNILNINCGESCDEIFNHSIINQVKLYICNKEIINNNNLEILKNYIGF